MNIKAKVTTVIALTLMATTAMGQIRGPKRPRDFGGTGIPDVTPTPPKPQGINGACCVQANPATNPANCSQSTPASNPPLNQWLPGPSNPGYAAAFQSQFAACKSLAPNCKWDTSNVECQEPRQSPTPKPTATPDRCLSTGGFYCGSTPTVPNVECSYGLNQIYLLSGGQVGQFQPIIPCPGNVCPPNTPPSGGCNKPGGLGAGTWISCGFNGIGGMPTGYYCR